MPQLLFVPFDSQPYFTDVSDFKALKKLLHVRHMKDVSFPIVVVERDGSGQDCYFRGQVQLTYDSHDARRSPDAVNRNLPFVCGNAAVLATYTLHVDDTDEPERTILDLSRVLRQEVAIDLLRFMHLKMLLNDIRLETRDLQYEVMQLIAQTGSQPAAGANPISEDDCEREAETLSDLSSFLGKRSTNLFRERCTAEHELNRLDVDHSAFMAIATEHFSPDEYILRKFVLGEQE
ncbi:uncharacterized protein EV422DRAFT_533287 [Fimicolochytrium jonesii]|uniref:uncharacterized protein n=1 Tax=Fimicolochytrium jonesii TaxID=1396493 RepID=UPI0022FDCE43|nr:uncharacterized protein EV422DRAFT_533287 [Fimicolochytrium jonesii]KAI8820020.1 hypothetical protein EV422DRAFT_533287 [Fimicolochytrium jonesii]